MSPWRFEKLLPPGVLGLGLVLAAAAGLWQHAFNARVVDSRFDALATRVAAQVQDRMELYEYGLRGARGAVIAAGGEAVTRTRFRQYAASRATEREFPGARGFGFIRRVPAGTEADFLMKARADEWPDFRIRELAPHRGDRYVIQYIEPVNPNREAVGLDIASEINRREAADRAVRTGEPALTGPVTLVQATGQKQRSFLLLLPIYRGSQAPATDVQRTASAIGWAYTPLVTDEVLQDVDYADGQYSLALYDRTANEGGESFFTSPGWQTPHAGSLVKQVGLSVYGRIWVAEVQAQPPFFHQLNLRSPVALGGAVAAGALLLAVLVYSYQLSARRERVVGLQRARMAAMVEHSPDAIIGMALDGVVRDWNPAAQRMFGYAASEAVGRTVGSLIVPDEQAAEETHLLERVTRGQSVPGFDTVRRRRDGRVIDVSVSVAPIRLERGDIAGAATTVRDISDRKAAEAEIVQLNATLEQQVAQRTAELRELAARERAVLTSAGSAVIAVDIQGLITLFNPAAEAMLGYRAAEVVGRMNPLVFHDAQELRQRCEARAEELGRPVQPGELLIGRAREGGVIRNEWTYVRRDGTRLPVLLTLSALRGDGGEAIGFIGVVTDLSDRARLQQELVDLNQALIERSEQAEAATRAKSEFLANMSHEIRTPMNAIIGLTEMMRRDARDAVLSERLEKVTDASRHLLAIINNVLDLSKIEAGRLVIEKVDFELSPVLSDTCALVIEDARAKGLEMVIDAGDAPARLVGDPTRLGQALLNLLSNAVKFTPSGFTVLRCRLVPDVGDGVVLRFEVVDSGVGVEPHALQALFRAFEQADTSTTRRYGGTGLGLAITRQLAELMGGHAGATSRHGHGSTFWFTARFGASSALPPVPDPRWARLRCLVADDLAHARRALVHAIERTGAQAEGTASPDEALTMLHRAEAAGKRYDVLVWDVDRSIGTARREAADTLAALRRTTTRLSLAVVFSSIRAAASVRRELKGWGRTHILEKPASQAAVERCLRTLMVGDTVVDECEAQVQEPHQERPFEGLRVLLAEDHPVNQMVATEQLRSLGLEVDVAETGAQALQRAREVRYDAILMDLHMPEMDGLEATRAIRDLPEHALTPILAMTASAFGEDRSASLAAGMDDHISKPVDTQILARTLGQWLGPHRQPPRQHEQQARPTGG